MSPLTSTVSKKGKLVLTLRPDGKTGTWISGRDYSSLKRFILRSLLKYDDLSFVELLDKATNYLPNLNWNVLVVKYDLEERGYLTNTNSHHYKRCVKIKLTSAGKRVCRRNRCTSYKRLPPKNVLLRKQ